MSWQAPWVWLGLITVALPILIHLLGRGKARRLPFPSLQFFGATRPLPTSRTRLHDLLLLAVRVAILVAAVAALAQPLLLTAHRRSSFDSSRARAVIVDTSASMQRTTATGEKAIDVAMRRAHQLADSASPGIVLATATPSGAIAGAVEWLDRQPGRSELVIASAFQAGTLDSVDLAIVPTNIGVQLVPIRVVASDAPAIVRSRRGAHDVVAQIAFAGAHTDITWTAENAAGAPDLITTFTGPVSARDVAIEEEAVMAGGLAPPADTGHHIAIVYSDYPERAALRARTKPIRDRWMSEASARIHRAESPGFGYPVAPADTGELLVVTRGFESKPLVVAGAATIDGRETLVLFSFDSLQHHGLIRDADHALADGAASTELDPATIGDAQLVAWQRPPAPRDSPGPSTDSSDGRWLWLAALILLGVESYLRRARPRDVTPGIVSDAAS